MWHVKQDTSFAECTHARASLGHGACKFYRWERSYIYIYISLRQLPPRLVRVLLVHLSIIYPWLLAIFHDWPLLTLINHWVHVLITDSLTLLKDCRSLNGSPTGPLRSGPGEETEKPGYGSEFPPAEGKSCSIWANYDYGEMTATTTTSPSCLWVRQFTSTNGWNLNVCFFCPDVEILRGSFTCPQVVLCLGTISVQVSQQLGSLCVVSMFMLCSSALFQRKVALV